MKKTVLIIYFLSLFIYSSSCEATTSRRDSVKEILNLKKESGSLLDKLNSVHISYINSDTLYLINNNKLIYTDLTEKRLKSNEVISDFLIEQSNKGLYATQIIVKDTKLYISFIDELFCLSNKGKVLYSYKHEREIYKFAVTQTGNVLLSSVGEITYLNKGLFKDSIKDENLATPDYFSHANGLGYLDNEKIDVFSESNLIIEKKSLNLRSVSKIESFYPLCLLGENLIGFSYAKRDQLYLIGISKELNNIKTIKLNKDFSPTLEELRKEEGVPDFEIITGESCYYVLVLKNNNFIVLKVDA